MSGHTPGPWFNDDNLWACITTTPGGRGEHLATCTSIVPPEEQRANARLMAAAPELLEEAEKQVEALRVAHITPSPGLVAAIMKARGGR